MIFETNYVTSSELICKKNSLFFIKFLVPIFFRKFLVRDTLYRKICVAFLIETPFVI